MTKITITEALAEIKLINEKIAKRRYYVLDNLVRVRQLADPLASKGGTSAVIASEVQSIADLETRLAKIRTAIMNANLVNTAEVGGQTLSIYEWLVWKREVAQNRRSFYEQIYNQTKRKLEEAQRQPQVYKGDNGQASLVEMEASLPYMDFATKHSDVADMLNKLDGVLSLKNATILIEV